VLKIVGMSPGFALITPFFIFGPDLQPRFTGGQKKEQKNEP